MQPLTIPPRKDLTEAQVTALIRDSSTLRVTPGAELLDTNLGVIEDISGDLEVGGRVGRDAYATLHGRCQLLVARQLDWGRAIIRPHITLDDGTTTARFNLGAYYTSVPTRDVELSPQVYEVDGHDILAALNTPVGDSYAVDAGVGYLAQVETVLTAQGYTQTVIDQQAAAKTLPAARVWPLDDQTTWLGVVNDLLAAVGYQGVWSDWDGMLRCQPYEAPATRAAEWYYAVTETESMLSPRRTHTRDYFDAPNRWVAVRSNNIDSPAPIEGNGVYTYVNEVTGDTSVEARGRVITRVMSFDVADHAALVAAAEQAIAADLHQREKITLETAPNPLHWHFDRLTVNDPDAGPIVDVVGTSWTLPLDGGDMQHEWATL